MKRQEPTHTSLCYEALKSADDFLTRQMLVAQECGNINQVCAALHVLRANRIVDVIISPDGTGWWFALPEIDHATYMRLLRTPEEKPRKKRKPAPKQIKELP